MTAANELPENEEVEEVAKLACHNCDCEIDIDTSYEGTDGNLYCESCHDELFVQCYSCNELLRRNRATQSDIDDEYYCQDCYEERFCHCEACNCEIRSGDAQSSESGEFYCSECYNDRFCTCDDCGCEILNDDAFVINGETYCSDCRPEDSGWNYGNFTTDGMFEEMKSRRRYGVEIETSKCPNCGNLEVESCFGCKDDGSIDGMEFVSPPMSGDKGLEEIKKFCNFASRHGFSVDRKCGLHIHLDVSKETLSSLKKICYAYKQTENLWALFAPDSRRRNSYCGKIEWRYFGNIYHLTDLSEFRDYTTCIGRYTWFNVAAYHRHETFEIRLHTGTIEYLKISNWLKSHCRFMDWAANATIDDIDNKFSDMRLLQHKFNNLAEILDDAELTQYLADRAEKFGNKLVVAEPVLVGETTHEFGEEN